MLKIRLKGSDLCSTVGSRQGASKRFSTLFPSTQTQRATLPEVGPRTPAPGSHGQAFL